MRSPSFLIILCLSTAAFAQPVPPADAPAPPPAPMTLQQFQQERVARTMQADNDHDGRVSKAEWEAYRASHPSGHGHGDGGGHENAGDGPPRRFDPDAMFARLDTNGDGYLTPDEIAAQAAERFRRMDRNGDGVLTPDEMHPRWGDGTPAPPPVR